MKENNPHTLVDLKKTGKSRTSWSAVSIRFAGDSGDGIQITGDRFAQVSAVLGNDVMTLADYPAEIRAPLGTIGGVSGYQLHLGSSEVYTPGDQVDILVALNPAALKANLDKVRDNGVIVVNKDAFNKGNLLKAGFDENPLETHFLDRFQVFPVPITQLTREALADSGLPMKQVDRCKNFFSLGLCCWLLNRPLKPTLDWIEQKFKKLPEIVSANQKVLRTGFHYGETAELFTAGYDVPLDTTSKAAGLYRYVSGNTALSLGLISASMKANRRLFLGSYPITPASDILHYLSSHKHYGVMTLQAEDEIAAVGAAIGASFGGHLGVTSTSGPGLALKAEFINLAVMVELPLVVINVQRAGPSTGMPTKTEQADLFQALWGRNGESPLVVLAPSSPGDCFDTAYLACKIAIEHMTPVIVLSDAHLANGSEPWKIAEVDSLEPIENDSSQLKAEDFKPYMRDPQTLVRPWVAPGRAGFEHTLGGLEKEEVTGQVCYEPLNHEKMCALRAKKVQAVAATLPPSELVGAPSGDLLILGWGSTFGAITKAVGELREEGFRVSGLCLKSLHPFAPDVEGYFGRFKKVLVPENNSGQLCMKIRAEFLVDAQAFPKIQGAPFKIAEIKQKAIELLGR